MDVDIAAIRQLIDTAPAGSTVLLAPDVYEQLIALAGEPPGVIWSFPGRGVEVRRSVDLGPGKAMCVTPIHLPKPPSFARGFLAKSGPRPGFVESEPPVVYDVRARTPAPPPPPPPPPAPPPPPRSRRREVDIEEAP